MSDITRGVRYLHKNLADKQELKGEELEKYILYDLYLKHPTDVETPINDSKIEKELIDILPAVRAYERQKEVYSKNKNREPLVEHTRTMLREIIELLQELYKNVDTAEEQDLFKQAFDIMHKIKE